MITMTKEAAEKFRELITNSKKSENTMVRVSFGGFG
jgi:Fe-S cluster assembly iron-binding protein IscA